MSSLTETAAWQALSAHRKTFDDVHMRDLFNMDESRAEKYSLQSCGLLLDYSKNLFTDKTLTLLTQLARDTGVCSPVNQLTARNNAQSCISPYVTAAIAKS